MRSPTPGPRNSLFNNSSTTNTTSNNTTHTTTSKRSITPNTVKHGEEKRVMSPTGGRPSGLRPPGSVASSVRSISRIGTVKKSW
jgi:hypothetical protein